MNIGQIKDGIVLDHITAGRSMEIYNVLNLDKLDCTVAMIQNAEEVSFMDLKAYCTELLSLYQSVIKH